MNSQAGRMKMDIVTKLHRLEELGLQGSKEWNDLTEEYVNLSYEEDLYLQYCEVMND